MKEMKEMKNKEYDMKIFKDMELPEEIKREILQHINKKESGYFDRDKFKRMRIKE